MGARRLAAPHPTSLPRSRARRPGGTELRLPPIGASRRRAAARGAAVRRRAPAASVRRTRLRLLSTRGTVASWHFVRQIPKFPRPFGDLMYCSRCGTQNDDASKFCRSCGLDLSHTTPVAAVRDQQVDATELDLVREQLKDEYEILDELGRGGMAIVFKAREKQLERDVAIKVLPFSLAFDKEFVERFQREARTSAKLEHPSIIPIYRVGKSGRVIYFVMKFLRGKPLSSVLAARGTLPPAEIRQILVQVARALAYAHKSGIVHRDIKPDNIMFDEHGLAVVTDFGIAQARSGGQLTGTGMSLGPPRSRTPDGDPPR